MRKLITTLFLVCITLTNTIAYPELVKAAKDARSKNGITLKTETLTDYDKELEKEAAAELIQTCKLSPDGLSSLLLPKNKAICMGSMTYQRNPYVFTNLQRVVTDILQAKDKKPFLLEPGYTKVAIAFDTTSPPGNPQRYCLMFSMSDESIKAGIPSRIFTSMANPKNNLPTYYYRFSKDLCSVLSQLAEKLFQNENPEEAGYDKEIYTVYSDTVSTPHTTSWTKIVSYLISKGESKILDHLNTKMGIHFQWNSDAKVRVVMVFEKIGTTGGNGYFKTCLEIVNQARKDYRYNLSSFPLEADNESCGYARKAVIACAPIFVVGKPIDQKVIDGCGFPKTSTQWVFLQGEKFDEKRQDDAKYELEAFEKRLKKFISEERSKAEILYSDDYSRTGVGSEAIKNSSGTICWNFFIYFESKPKPQPSTSSATDEKWDYYATR